MLSPTASSEDHTRLVGAREEEADSWLTARAVTAFTSAGVDLARLLRCRSPQTWKRDEAQPDGKKPNARLVALGFADLDIERLRSEAPVASRRARRYFLALSAGELPAIL